MREIADADAYVGFGMPRALFRRRAAIAVGPLGAAGVGSLLYPETGGAM